MAEVEFVEELPEPNFGGRRLGNSRAGRLNRGTTILLAQLRAEPGRWALIDTREDSTRARQQAASLRRSTHLAGVGDQYEFASRSTDSGFAVYGRFVGELEASA